MSLAYRILVRQLADGLWIRNLLIRLKRGA